MTGGFLPLLMLGIAILFIIVGAHVGVALGATAVIFAYIGWGPGLVSIFPDRLYTTMTSFSMEAVPLFIFMGVILERSGVAERLFTSLGALIGHVRGGLLIVVIVLCVMFAACTGISGAAAVAIGLVSLPSMLKAHYDKAISTGTICAGAGLGVIIPPSIMLILYGPVAGISVTELFTACIFPGLLLGGLYLAYVLIACHFKPELGPATAPEERVRIPKREKLVMVLVSILPTFGLIAAVLGSILFGIATPTEAAAVGCIGAMVICAAYRRFNLPMLKDSVWSTFTTTAMIMLIVVGANLFTTVFLGLGGATTVENFVLGLHLGTLGTISVMLFIILVLGLFMDWVGILLICLPIYTPIIATLGIDPLWFAVLFCITLQLSYVTPPFSYSVFYVKGIAPPEVELSDIYRGVIPFIPIQLFALALLYVFPSIGLWLVSVTG